MPEKKDLLQPGLTASASKAAIADPTTPADQPLKYTVNVKADRLMLRSEPDATKNNIIARLPDGHMVQALSNKKTNNFFEVETSIRGAYFKGFASADFLTPVVKTTVISVETPDKVPPSKGIVAVYMPQSEKTITKRTLMAGARSLNEPGQPTRTGSSPEELKASIAAIIKWLAVDKLTHIRYLKRGMTTFCNIYAHDFCYLAGIYLPRVWWSGAAIRDLAQNKKVDVINDETVDEQRANDLFRWLRDFGLNFGWRQTGTLTKLQTEVNKGAVGIIVARRKDNGRPGHIVIVVPETDEFTALRKAGEVTAPVQSQAGGSNFQYGNGRHNWWLGNEFAESSFWLHA